MKIIKNSQEADEIIKKLENSCNEDGKIITYTPFLDTVDVEDSIKINEENQYPTGYGLIIISSNTDKKVIDKIKKGEKQIVLLGASNNSKSDIEIIEKNRIRNFNMKKITELGLSEVVDLVMESAITHPKLCLSINLNCLDKSFTTEGVPAGMTTRELIYSIQRLKLMKNLKTVEIEGKNTEIITKIIKELS